MKRAATPSLAVILCALLFCRAAAGADAAGERRKKPFSMELSAGAEYDSNVSIDEIDASTSAGDASALLDADFGYRLALAKNTGLDLSYRLSQTLHDDFSQFDLQNHMLSADVAHDFGQVDAGAAYRYINTRLDNDAFLSMHQLSPHVARFFGKKLFVRADYTYSDKRFDLFSARDAKQHAAGADCYFFLRGIRTYVLLGYRYKAEDARDAQFDYRSHNTKLRLSQRFTIMDRSATLKLSWLHEARDYRTITPGLGAQRNDDRDRLQAELEVPVNQSFFVTLQYEHDNFGSDLASADYSQQVASVKLGFRI